MFTERYRKLSAFAAVIWSVIALSNIYLWSFRGWPLNAVLVFLSLLLVAVNTWLAMQGRQTRTRESNEKAKSSIANKAANPLLWKTENPYTNHPDELR